MDHRMPGEFYYGFEPKEPEPIGRCAWCDDDIYNEDHIVEGDIICPACEEYYFSNESIIDFAKQYFGSMPEIIKECRFEDWFPDFAKTIRAWYGDMLVAMIKNDDAVLPNDAVK